MLTREIAENIVRETMVRLNRNINIMDENGMIIASGDPSRVGQFHEGALEVIQSGKMLTITYEDKDKYQGTLSGINLPIEFRGDIVGVIGITGEKKEVEEFGGLVKMTTEMMIQQSFLAAQSEWEQRTSDMILDELLQPKPSLDFIHQRLKLLELSLSGPFFSVIIEIKERNMSNPQLISFIKEMLGESHSIVGFTSVHRLFALVSLEETELQKRIEQLHLRLIKLGTSSKIAIGSEAESFTEVWVTYQEAQIALGVEKTVITYYSQIEAKAHIYQLDNQVKRRFLERIFPDLSEKTIETLKTFFQCNLNLVETAKEMFIHRNTLLYRIRKFKEDTGYDPQLFNDAVTLQIACWMYDSLKEKT